MAYDVRKTEARCLFACSGKNVGVLFYTCILQYIDAHTQQRQRKSIAQTSRSKCTQ